MAAGLYRRSLPNALRAMVYGLAVTFIHIPSQWAVNDSMFAFLRMAGPKWHSLLYFFAWIVLPNILSVLTLGIASAALFGFSKQRSRFLLSASFASALFIVQGAVFRVLPWENDGDTQVIGSMASLLGGLIWGVALAWPVARLEREAAVLNEAGL